MHLDEETLARLATEPADASETSHLASCESCRSALREQQQLVGLLRGLPLLAPPSTQWNSIHRTRTLRPFFTRRSSAMFLAATLLLTVGGISGAAWQRWVSARTTEHVLPLTAAQQEEPATAAQLLARLAALDGILLTTDAAMRHAPGDSVIASYQRLARSERASLLHRVRLVSDQHWY